MTPSAMTVTTNVKRPSSSGSADRFLTQQSTSTHLGVDALVPARSAGPEQAHMPAVPRCRSP